MSMDGRPPEDRGAPAGPETAAGADQAVGDAAAEAPGAKLADRPASRKAANRSGVAHRHRDRAGEKALEGTSSLRNYNDSYTSFVSAMKVALPLLALVLVGVVLMLPQLDSAEKKVRAGIRQQIKAQDLENLYMVNARYIGSDEKNRAYTLTANSARQVSTDSDLVALEAPKADVATGNGHWVAMRASAGAFYRKAQTLVLFGDVNIFHDEGYTVRTDEIEMNLKSGTAKGSKPVVAHGPLGILRARGFKILDRGQTVLFTGKARLTIYPDNDKTKGLLKVPGLGGTKPSGKAAKTGGGK